MITHGNVYKWSRKLELLEDTHVDFLPKPYENDLMRYKIQQNRHSIAVRHRNFTLRDSSKYYIENGCGISEM